MDSPFEKLGRDERQEWRDGPTTQAFLATLDKLRGTLIAQVLSAVKGAARETETLAELGGRLNTLDDINLLIRRDTK